MEKIYIEIYKKLGIPQDYAESCLKVGTVPAFSGQSGKRCDRDLQGLSAQLAPNERAFAYIEGQYFLAVPGVMAVSSVFMKHFLVVPEEETDVGNVLVEDKKNGGFWVPAVKVSEKYAPMSTYVRVLPMNDGIVMTMTSRVCRKPTDLSVGAVSG